MQWHRNCRSVIKAVRSARLEIGKWTTPRAVESFALPVVPDVAQDGSAVCPISGRNRGSGSDGTVRTGGVGIVTGERTRSPGWADVTARRTFSRSIGVPVGDTSMRCLGPQASH